MKKNTEFTLYFSLFKTDGTLIANPGTITKKISIDGGAMANITASVTEEDTTYGQLSVVLSAAEMNGTGIWVSIKDDTSGCIPYIVTLYPDLATLGEIKTETAELKAAVITNAAGTDIAADIIALKAVADTIQADTDLLDDAAGGIADIHTDVAAIATTIGVAGAGLTAVPWNAAWDAQAQSECADAITAAGLATDVNLNNWMALMATAAELAKVPKSDGVVSWNATALAAIRTAIGLAGANLDAQLGDIPNNAEFAAALAAADDAVLAAIADIPTNAEFTNALAALNDFDPSTDKVDLVDAPNATALVAMAVALLDTLLSEGDADALNARTVRSALRAIRNKQSVNEAGDTLTVTKENDTDAAWTAAITTDAASEPITAIDPA